MTKSEKLTELRADLVEIKAALTAIRKGGQSYTISSLSSGSSRTITNADYSTLLEEKRAIEGQIASLESRRAMRVRPGW